MANTPRPGHQTRVRKRAGPRPGAAPRLASAALLGAWLLGCAATAPPGRTVLEDATARRLLVLPLNVTIAMPGELLAFSPAVWAEIERYLQETDRELRTVDFRAARGLWRESIARVRERKDGARAGFEEAARDYVAELSRHAEFDAVIAPSLFIREASIQGRKAEWDGVAREVEIEAYGPGARRLATAPLEGVAPAASLHAVVLDAEGNILQQTQGGLELLVNVRVSVARDSVPAAPAFEYVTRTDLFGDPELLREGIAIALAPFLTPPPK